MEAPEVPTEHLHEEMHHQAEHGGNESRWISGVALSSAIIAGFAAIASLMAGVHANEAMIAQMRASDAWNYYQAKGVKAAVLSTKVDLVTAIGKTPEAKDAEKIGSYKKDQGRIKEKASEFEEASHEHLETHEAFARSVTLFQVAIALAAVSVLTKRRRFWYFALLISVAGGYFVTEGMIRSKSQKEPEPLVEETEAGGEKAHGKKGEASEHAAAAGKSAEHGTPAGEEKAGEKPKGE